MYCWWTYVPNFSFTCQPIDWGMTVVGLVEAQAVYCFYCLKLLDLCDTVFFILRKRTRQVTFLHVYHHLAVLICTYKAVGWAPGNQFSLFFQLFYKKYIIVVIITRRYICNCRSFQLPCSRHYVYLLLGQCFYARIERKY